MKLANVKNVSPIPDHEYAQAKIITFENGTIMLQSYNTIVASVTDDGWLDCTGTYSRTTIKHIGWFMQIVRSKFGCGNYYTAKNAYETGTCVNLLTGEVLTYEEYNTMRDEEEKKTA